MDLNSIDTCTRCRQKLKGMKFFVSLDLTSLKEKESGVWEQIAPLSTQTNEVVCEECFRKFIDSIDKGNN